MGYVRDIDGDPSGAGHPPALPPASSANPLAIAGCPDHHHAMSDPAASPAHLLEAGLGHHRAGDLAGAARCYQRALERAPDDARGWHLLGLTHAQAGDAADAEALFIRALAIDPDHAEAHCDLGNLRHRQGRHAEAAACHRAALATGAAAPLRARAWNDLGTTLRQLGENAAAIAAWREALAIEPGRIGTHYCLATALLDTGALHDAVIAYRAVLAAQPRHREAKRGLEAATRRSGEPD